MPAIDEINIQPVVDSTTDGNIIKDYVKAQLWDWLLDHENEVVKTVSFWFIHRTIYVRDFEPLAVLLLGPRP